MFAFPLLALRIAGDVPDGSVGFQVPLASWGFHMYIPRIFPEFLRIDGVLSRVVTFIA